MIRYKLYSRADGIEGGRFITGAPSAAFMFELGSTSAKGSRVNLKRAAKAVAAAAHQALQNLGLSADSSGCGERQGSGGGDGEKEEGEDEDEDAIRADVARALADAAGTSGHLATRS